MLNHVLYYIGVTALVLVGLIVAISAFVSIFANIRKSRAEFAEEQTHAAEQVLAKAEEQALTEAENITSTDSGNPTIGSITHNDVDAKEVEEQ